MHSLHGVTYGSDNVLEVPLQGAEAHWGPRIRWFFSVHLYLTEHWRATRPYAPRPALGWTEHLPWCLGAHGTAKEAHFLDSSFSWLIVPFMAIMVSAAIDYYKFGIWPLRTQPKIPK